MPRPGTGHDGGVEPRDAQGQWGIGDRMQVSTRSPHTFALSLAPAFEVCFYLGGTGVQAAQGPILVILSQADQQSYAWPILATLGLKVVSPAMSRSTFSHQQCLGRGMVGGGVLLPEKLQEPCDARVSCWLTSLKACALIAVY